MAVLDIVQSKNSYTKRTFERAKVQHFRKVQENKFCSKLNGTDQLLVYVDDNNLLSDNTIKENPEKRS